MEQVSEEHLWRLVFECAGATTGVIMLLCPHVVMPADEVSEAVRTVMSEWGYTPPEGYRAREEV